VSKSLVSLVLRNSPKVSATSREAVMRAVAELGYRPNAAARLLAERRSHTIGVLLNDLRQPWFADMLDGLTPALHAGGKHILLGDGRIDRMLDETLTWSFIDLGVDGLVLAGSIPMSQVIIDAASQIPTVAVGGRGLDADLPRADILANDNHLGGTLAVRHLIELGHTRIAHIHGLPSVAGRLRMEGYEDTMRAAGLGDYVHIEAGDMSEEGGYRATVRLLSGQDRPTAIFAANDLTCVGALSAAAALGVRVPEELSLVGFDNSVFARLRALWLTSVDATAFELGQRAARMLLARIERPDTPGETVLVPPRLEVRGSSGPAPPRPSRELAQLRELAFEGLDGAVAPAVGEGLGHGIGEDVLLTPVHRVEDGARDGLRGGLRDVEVPGHVGIGGPDQDGVDPHAASGQRGAQRLGQGERGRLGN
jgi:DNA-binding LacI/PurR family transcriptional regulator